MSKFKSPNGSVAENYIIPPGDKSETQFVHIKDWDYVQEHNRFVTAVPDMEPFCGKDATIIEIVTSSPAPGIPTIYSIFEDGGKYWWSQEWLENIEE